MSRVKAKVVYLEKRTVDNDEFLVEMYVRGTVIPLNDLLYYEEMRRLLVIETGGRFMSYKLTDEEGERLSTTAHTAEVIAVKNTLAAPRLCVTAADEWFQKGPEYLRARAELELCESTAGAVGR